MEEILNYLEMVSDMRQEKKIVKKIRKKRADYVLALKRNQVNLHEDVNLFFDEPEFLSGCAYHKSVEKARGGTEIREYWQTDNIAWLPQKKDWTGLKTTAM
ncbi:MAG: ISAs1 family transposase, partial [Oscillospiraceae bacterium]|nr:ISAs1 family transposase [Oscillospiraceae bacterium]